MNLNDERVLNTRLLYTILSTADVIDDVAENMCNAENYHWHKSLFGHTFTMSRDCITSDSTKSIVTTFKSWFQTHEEAQVMLASLLIVIALWWLVRTTLALLINLVCPVIFVFLAVFCIPQLREPLLGQNYPVVANLIRNILLKMAENLKS